MPALGRLGVTNRLASALLFGAVALAPFPFGSVSPAVVAAWCVVLGVALAASSISDLSARQIALLWIAGPIVAAYALVLHEQISDHPWLRISPDPIWRGTADLLHQAVTPSVSIARNQPLLALGAPLAALLAMICGTIVGAKRHRARRLLEVIAWSGACYAVAGTVLFLIDPAKVLWREKIAYAGSLTGTFINRNTAAVYFGACGTVCLLLLLDRMRSLQSDGKLPRLATLASFAGASDRGPIIDVAIDLARFLACFTAMLMSNSRAGIVFSLIGMIVGFAGLFWRRASRRSLIAATAAAVGAALVMLQTVAAGVAERFSESGLGDLARLDTYRSTLQIIADHPWLGTGFGTFPLSFPGYRSDHASVLGTWDRAHNTLLEIAAEAGMPLAALVAVGWILVLAILLNGIRRRRRDLIIPVAAFSTAMTAILHSLIDFSLQISGYAIVIFALVGAGLAQSFSSRDRRREKANLIENQDVVRAAAPV